MDHDDLGSLSHAAGRIEYVPIPEERKLQLASGVLLGTFILFVLSATAAISFPTTGDKIFETSKVVLPPIVSLVLGYYFSRSNNE